MDAGSTVTTIIAGRRRIQWLSIAAATVVTLGIGTIAPTASAAETTTSLIIVRSVAAAATVATASCPKAPKAPANNKNYRLDGLRWDPKDTIDYVVDTARLRKSQITARIADTRKAMREAARYSGLKVSYQGTETKLASSQKRFLVQFEWSHSSYVVQTALYTFTNDAKQMYSAKVDVDSTTATGYGRFNTKHPDESAEGHMLLFGAGSVSGLNSVSKSDHQVMNPIVTKRFFATSYQAGDKRGLWEAGASKGCGGFVAVRGVGRARHGA